MQLFPDFTETAVSNLDTSQSAAEIQTSLKYDHENKQFYMIDGSPVLCMGKQAVREWIALMLRVQRGKDPVFAEDCGIDVDGLLGTRAFPDGFTRSEMIREIRETLALCPAISGAEGFEVTRIGTNMAVHFTALLRNGETLEVNENVGG